MLTCLRTLFVRSRPALLMELAEHQDQRTRDANTIAGLHALRDVDAELITGLRGQLEAAEEQVADLKRHGREAEQLLAVLTPATTEEL